MAGEGRVRRSGGIRKKATGEGCGSRDKGRIFRTKGGHINRGGSFSKEFRSIRGRDRQRRKREHVLV